jgi:transketolase
MKYSNEELTAQLANCVRFLSIDAIQKANSGHPGLPMGMADVATILFTEFLKFKALRPDWIDRDRFILSAGHGSMLLYSILYLTGHKDIDLEDIKNFRQLNSKCAGHPEFGHINAIETTTGPLGQGLANAVGMAISEKLMSERYGADIINHKTYCLVGDGCLMEGISQESISIAGHLNLNKLIVLWDNNSISIDGSTEIATSENMKMRFEACNWQVIQIDGHNYGEIRQAFNQAQKSEKPVLIDCKTKIGFGSPSFQGSSKCHGAPLGEDEVIKVRQKLNWDHAHFAIPNDLYDYWHDAGKRHRQDFHDWEERFHELSESKQQDLKRIMRKDLPENFAKKLNLLKQKIFLDRKEQPTRKSSQETLEFLTKELPEMIGGSADLSASVLTKTSSTKSVTKDDFSGRYIHYGVREHAMAAIMNGIALHSSFIPYGGTFLVFADYMKPAIRLSALMKQRILYIFTHDSIGLGEDGPTHQPVEHLAMLRSIPNLYVFRPCDSQETIGCYEQALKIKDAPSAIILTRQKVSFLRSEYQKDQASCSYGAYIVSNTALDIDPDVILIASGSELSIAMEAKNQLHKYGFAVRVVSIPCFELFEKQDSAYKNRILGKNNTLRIGIEAGIYQGWNRYIGKNGIFIGMDDFGASGKSEDLYQHFNITADNICKQALTELKSRRVHAITRYKDKDDELDEIDKRVQKEMDEEENED